MFNNSKIIILIFVFILLIQNLVAQESEVKISVQKDTIIVGEQIKMEIFAKTAKTDKVIFPNYKDTLTKSIEILAAYKERVKEESNSKTISKTYLISSFDTGNIVIPILNISVINGSGDSILFKTEEKSFYVKPFVVLDTIPRDSCFAKVSGTIIRGHNAFQKEIAEQIPDSIRENITADSLKTIEKYLFDQFSNIFSSQLTQKSGLYNESDINKIIFADESSLFIVDKSGILQEEAVLGNLDSLYVTEFQGVEKKQLLFTSFKIKDIVENNIDTPFTFSEFLYYLKSFFVNYWWILLILILIVLIIYFIYYKKKHQSIKPQIFRKKIIPAHVIALEKLNKIKQEKLAVRGQVKEYYVQISDTLREYLENRFGVNITDMTTTQILNNINEHNLLDNYNTEKIKKVLEISDLVKFAKYQPLQNENDNCLDLSFQIVNSTKEEVNASEKSEK